MICRPRHFPALPAVQFLTSYPSAYYNRVTAGVRNLASPLPCPGLCKVNETSKYGKTAREEKMNSVNGTVRMLVVLGCLLLVSSGVFAGSSHSQGGNATVTDGAVWGGKGGGSPEGAVWGGGRGGGGPEGAIWGGKGGGNPEGTSVHVAGNPGQGYLHGLGDFLRFLLDGAVWGGNPPPPGR